MVVQNPVKIEAGGSSPSTGAILTYYWIVSLMVKQGTFNASLIVRFYHDSLCTCATEWLGC